MERSLEERVVSCVVFNIIKKIDDIRKHDSTINAENILQLLASPTTPPPHFPPGTSSSSRVRRVFEDNGNAVAIRHLVKYVSYIKASSKASLLIQMEVLW